MLYITEQCGSNFIMVIKSYRVVALSQSDKQKGKYVSIQSIKLEGRTISVYFKQYDKPVLIGKQVFKNEGGSTGKLYLASSDLNLDFTSLTTIYEKRWIVEGFFRSIKSNAAFAKPPTKTEKTQVGQFTASMIAFTKPARLKLRNNRNHYAMKNQIWRAATKTAWKELQKLSTPNSIFAKFAA